MVPRGLFCKNIESHGVGCLGVQPAGLHPCVTDVPPSHRSGKMLCSRPLGCLEECKLRIGINVTHTARMILFHTFPGSCGNLLVHLVMSVTQFFPTGRPSGTALQNVDGETHRLSVPVGLHQNLSRSDLDLTCFIRMPTLERVTMGYLYSYEFAWSWNFNGKIW